MASSFWIMVGVIVVTSILADMVVKIVKSSKSGGGKDVQKRIDDLEADLGTMEQELSDARERIVVLEKIVTDDKHNLSRQIDDLAAGDG